MNKNVLTIGMVVGAFISILSFRSDSAQAQNSSYWSINREQYFTGEWTVQNFPCPDKKRYTAPVRITTNNNYVEGVALTNIPCLPASQKVFAVRLDSDSITYDAVFQSTIYNSKTYYNTNTGSVATLRIVSQNSFNINASKPPVKFTKTSSIESKDRPTANQPDRSNKIKDSIDQRLCKDNGHYVVFAQRPLKPLNFVKIPRRSGTDSDRNNVQLAHEHIFFCNNKKIERNIGFGPKGRFSEDNISKKYSLIDEGKYDANIIDAILGTGLKMCYWDGNYGLRTNNCQDFTSRVRQEYWKRKK
jgi:hypothetical protein